MSAFLANLRRHDTFFDVLWVGHWFSNRFGLSPLVYRKSGTVPTYKRIPYSGQHYIVQYSIQYRFKELNRYLCELLPTEMEHSNNFRLFYVSKNRTYLLIHVTEMADLYHSLVELIDKYNENFGLQLLMTHLGSTCVTIFSGFTMYRALVDKNRETIYMGINNLCWSIYYSIYQLLSTILGEMVRSESKKMGKLLHKSIELINDEEIRDKLLHFSNQIYQRTSIISCKWFDFDNALIFSTMGAITTYLVILIQFDVTSQQN
ncbi:putative gustatory receptor 28b [Sabethes cyaneus]|uniref:putative gustatory receptor 28b n=1 Tax=Sabethes cyaneus TaxID=53552 RepID=UPI00237EE4E6|nr:putative gustatory receptor 28b [Sabethes cyaneus]